MSDALTREERSSEEIEDIILAHQKARGPQPNITFLAFTATPRNVTLERFGVSWGVIWDTLAYFGVGFACMQVTSVPLSPIFRKYLFSQ